MKTAVIMKRNLLGGEVGQNSKTGFLSLTDLMRIGNRWRINNGRGFIKQEYWLQNKSTKEFIKTLEEKFGNVKITGRGRGHHTWVHPFLFIDAALALNPSLKIEVYSWIYDNLLEYRDHSGDTYKKMAGSIYLNISNKSQFRDMIVYVARKIKQELEVIDWQTADEKTLKLRDKIQEYISLYCDVLPIYDAIRVSIVRAKEAVQ